MGCLSACRYAELPLPGNEADRIRRAGVMVQPRAALHAIWRGLFPRTGGQPIARAPAAISAASGTASRFPPALMTEPSRSATAFPTQCEGTQMLRTAQYAVCMAQ